MFVPLLIMNYLSHGVTAALRLEDRLFQFVPHQK